MREGIGWRRGREGAGRRKNKARQGRERKEMAVVNNGHQSIAKVNNSNGFMP